MTQRAIKLKVDVAADHTVRLPDEVPVGPAELIVLVEDVAPSGAPEGRVASPRLVHRADVADFEMTIAAEPADHA